MAFERQIQLLERLVQKTNEGELEWKRSPEEGVFQVILRKNTLRLRRTEGGSGSEMFTLEMIDSSGEVADSFSDAELDEEAFGRVDQGYFRMMKNLYEFGRRQALGADKILNEILRDLQ